MTSSRAVFFPHDRRARQPAHRAFARRPTVRDAQTHHYRNSRTPWQRKPFQPFDSHTMAPCTSSTRRTCSTNRLAQLLQCGEPSEIFFPLSVLRESARSARNQESLQ